ncbi:asparaginase [Kineosporia sp. R_H_3]|uniref:asparaginase n=1 Tax=Kineosporia sp. R_H_3 TaxID=1961848 RepID=UPI000B4B7D7C|nr:asparaginase [Kineosporia sp. R_H_3]
MTYGLLARVVRSGFVEGEHRGTAVALDPAGAVVAAVGDVTAPIFPRSSNKPMQAVAMLRAGLRLDGHLLALAASSHSGERYHQDGVARVLGAAGLTVDALRNTADLPLDEVDRLAWQVAGRAPTAQAQNCSGKHAAMLATCAENDWPLDTYLDPVHPLQTTIAATVADLAGEAVAATGVDGCGAPVLAISTVGLARAFARISTAPAGTPEARVADAVRTHPEWLGGTGRDVTAVLRAVPGLVAKDGAEAVYAAALPDGRAVAVKVADGSDRARVQTLVALLRRLGVEDGADGVDGAALDALAHVPVLGHGREVGVVEVAF